MLYGAESLGINGFTVQGKEGGQSSSLWNLVLDSLIKMLNCADLYSLSYADDLPVLLTGKFENTLC